MFLDNSQRHSHVLRAHVSRHRFLYLSLVLHVLPLAALGHLHYVDRTHTESARRERVLASGMQMTEQARLEKRVQDMAQIKSLLEQSTGAPRAPGPDRRVDEDDDVATSAERKQPKSLLKDARELARDIETIERDIKAEQLAKLLKIPKEKALERLANEPKPEEAVPEPKTREEAAAKIAQLEAKARQVLEQRRQQLEQQRNGTPVAAGTQGEQSGGARNARKGPGGTGQGNGSGNPGTGDGAGNTGGSLRTSTLDRIAAFANPDLPDRRTTEYTGRGGTSFFDTGIGHIPEVDAKQMVKGSGRIIGPGGAYANRVYVNSWYLIGPFVGKFGGELFSNYRHAPEDAVVLDAVYRGKGNRLLKWEYVNMAKYPLMPPDPAENAVYYGYTELMLDEEQDLTVWVGADDDAQLWINDKLAWKGGNINKDWFFSEIYHTANTYVRDYNLSEGKRVVRFRKGRNRLFFKLSNGPTRLFFSLVLTKEH